ncbi:unnamed protein product [Dovyalis caffra]|uniref:Uncharacterized protein n=1 Tax=Dovyalis caffra TaxID=77055 RepID=A0AAV1RY79_9ROSI|nr:unnamed protein product [Dovyalis caffra]
MLDLRCTGFQLRPMSRISMVGSKTECSRAGLGSGLGWGSRSPGLAQDRFGPLRSGIGIKFMGLHGYDRIQSTTASKFG